MSYPYRVYGPSLPIAPLEPLVGRPLTKVFPPSLKRAYNRARKRGHTSLYSADRFAAALGLHPAEIWCDEYWERVNQ